MQKIDESQYDDDLANILDNSIDSGIVDISGGTEEITDEHPLMQQQASGVAASGKADGTVGARQSLRSNKGVPGKFLHMDPSSKRYHQYLMLNRRRTKKKKVMFVMKSTSGENKSIGDTNIFDKAVNVILQQVKQKDKPTHGEFDQVSARTGIKMFGEEAVTAMIKEFSQLDRGAFPGKPVVEPIDSSTITPQEKKKALEAVNLIKKNAVESSKGVLAQMEVVKESF